MRKKSLKAAALAALGGMVFQFGGGCLGWDNWWGRVVWDGLLDVGWEVLLDYDAVYDLWAD
jgi:hypothetical protein